MLCSSLSLAAQLLEIFRRNLLITTPLFASSDIEEDGLRINLTIVDTPGFGDNVNNDLAYVNLSYSSTLALLAGFILIHAAITFHGKGTWNRQIAFTSNVVIEEIASCAFFILLLLSRMILTRDVFMNFSFQEIVNYLERQYDDILAEQSRIKRNPRFRDNRVHCLLYFIPPTGH